VIVLTRQKLPTLDPEKYNISGDMSKGAYILSDSSDKIDVILIATGSEVQLALQAKEKLESQDIGVRIVSMPSMELFDMQEDSYKEKILATNIKSRVAIEAGSSFGWRRWVGSEGIVIGVDKFGSSAPYTKVLQEYGFTVDNIICQVKKLLSD